MYLLNIYGLLGLYMDYCNKARVADMYVKIWIGLFIFLNPLESPGSKCQADNCMVWIGQSNTEVNLEILEHPGAC
jgi:hypothetical protein